MSEEAMNVDVDGQVSVSDAPAETEAPKEEGLYAPLTKEDPVEDNMVKVRDDEPSEEKPKEDAPVEEERLYADKYKSVEDLEKAHKELYKQFRAGDHKPVDLENYKNEKLEDFGIPEDDPLLQGFNEFAKEHKMSKEAYDGLISTFIEAVGAQDVQVKQAREEIMQELGPNADGIIKDMGQWAQGMAQSGIWSDEEYAWFTAAADSAVGTRALMKIRESYADRIPFKATVPAGGDKISHNELEQLMNAKDDNGALRYDTDAAYRAEVDRKAAASFN